MKPIELRPYQQRFIDDLRSEIISGQRRICGVAPCGAGKTIMMGWMIHEAVSYGKRCLFFVHRNELIEQTANTFHQLGINFGIISANYDPNYAAKVQIASVQTLVRRLDKIAPPDLIICDECHHILAKSYKSVVDKFPSAILIGVTATPERTGHVRLNDIFTAMVQAPTVRELIDMGNLTNFQYFAPVKDFDLSGVRVKFHEYVKSDLEQAMMANPKIVGDIVENYRHYASGLSTICYCVNVKHSMYVADKFKSAGISAAHVDGETDRNVRRKIVDAFRAGKIQVLCNAELFGEGFDVPNVSAVILARPTMSLTLYIQQAMRCMRPDPNNPDKVAVIIDHVRNYIKFGLPDSPFEWSLKPLNKPPAPPKDNKECPQCSAVIPALAKICPHCKYVFTTTPRETKLGESAGEVAQVHDSRVNPPPAPAEPVEKAPAAPTIEQTFYRYARVARHKGFKLGWAAYQVLKSAKCLEDCQKIGELAGFKPGWARCQWQELQQAEK